MRIMYENFLTTSVCRPLTRAIVECRRVYLISLDTARTYQAQKVKKIIFFSIGEKNLLDNQLSREGKNFTLQFDRKIMRISAWFLHDSRRTHLIAQQFGIVNHYFDAKESKIDDFKNWRVITVDRLSIDTEKYFSSVLEPMKDR